jgi:putative ABC transport system ATP-binding protein
LRSDAAAGARCDGVVKIYWTATHEVHALKGIDASFRAGQVTAVVGPSGSGKSSLLRILGGLDRATAGVVSVGGALLTNASVRALRGIRRRHIGYVYQRPSDNLVPRLTATDHLAYAARLRGACEDEVDELLDALGLTARRDHRPVELSGGEQQRLAVAQAAIGGPALLIADEPTAELDRATGAGLIATLRTLAARGVAVVVATHDAAVVEAADRTLLLRHGALEAEAREARQLSVFDASGRIQFPPEALALFPERRAVLELRDGEVGITPP